jgi:hypothetical protein
MILLQSVLFLFCLSFQDLELTHLPWSVSWLIEMQLSVLSSNMSTELCTLRIFLNAWLRSLLANWRYHVSYFYLFFYIRKPDISCICSFCISDSSSVVDAWSTWSWCNYCQAGTYSRYIESGNCNWSNLFSHVIPDTSI